MYCYLYLFYSLLGNKIVTKCDECFILLLISELFVCFSYPVTGYPSVTELAIFDVHDIDSFYFQSFSLCFF